MWLHVGKDINWDQGTSRCACRPCIFDQFLQLQRKYLIFVIWKSDFGEEQTLKQLLDDFLIVTISISDLEGSEIIDKCHLYDYSIHFIF